MGFFIKQPLGPHLNIERNVVAFNRAASYRLDVERFLDNLGGGEADEDGAKLRAAVGLYRGDFLAGLQFGGAPLFEEWLLGQRERLKGLAVQALHALAAYHTERQEYTAASDFLSRLLALEPWREDSHRQLMTMLAASGQRDAALAQYEACRRMLLDELGFEPSAPTIALFERIKAGELELRPAVHHNLPLLPTPLLGRDDERARVAELLTEYRLVTLTGPGGVGKTSLALNASWQALPDFPGGVFFVPLAPLNDPALVTEAIAGALGVQEVAGQSLEERLQAEPTLLLLDNFEHLLGAAPIVAELLAHGSALKVMMTSRALLELRAEHVFEVPPLAVPDLRGPLQPETLLQYPAVTLFCERAEAIRPGFKLTAENAAAVAAICVRLDGLPLALELAAAWVKSMSPGALLTHLGKRLELLTGGARDLPLRQQTLKNTLAWSFELLEPELQALFAQLAVFVGGFTLAAAAEVCAAPHPQVLPVLEGVARLANQSLLQREELVGEVRFKMLETIREYALERLEVSGQVETLRQRHATYFRDLAEQAEAGMKGAEQVSWLASLERELDNIRAALAWVLESKEQELGLRLAGALPWFWFMRGNFGEGRDWLERMLALNGEVAPRLQAQAPYGVGMLARRRGDEAAAEQLETALKLFRQLGDDHGVAACLHHLAHVAEEQGDYLQATALFAESLTLARKAGDGWELTLSLTCLGHAVHEQGDDAWATALLEESLAVCRDTGNKYGIGDALRLLGLIAFHRGDFKQATERLEGSLALFGELGNRQGIALLFPALARAALYDGDLARAKNLLRQGLALRSEGGKLGLSEYLRGWAEVAWAENDLRGAARFLGRAEAVFATSTQNHPSGDHDALTEKLCAALSEDVFEAARAEGRTMETAEAVDYTLGREAFSEPAASGHIPAEHLAASSRSRPSGRG